MQNESIKDNVLAIFTPSMLACAVAFALITFSGSLTNAYLYSYVSATDGWIREASTLVLAATFLAVTAAAYYRPQVVKARGLVVLCCVFSVASVVFATVGFQMGNMAFVSLGIFGRSVGRALAICLFSLRLVQLKSSKQVSFAIALGLFMASVLDLGKAAVGTPLFATILMAAAHIGVALWAARGAGRVLSITCAGDSVDDLKLADPAAFLPMFHGVFVCILLFSAASGFALTFNEVAGAPATSLFATPLLAALLLFLLVSWGNKREDFLFSVSVLIVMAGFLTTPLSFNETFANTSGTLLRFGEQCFDVLAWTVVMAIGRRNVYGCLFTVGAMRVMSSLGTIVGAMSGHVTNGFVQNDFVMATGFALSMVFAFFAFLWCGFRTFSFSDAIESVTAVSRPVSSEPPMRYQAASSAAEEAVRAADAPIPELVVAGGTAAPEVPSGAVSPALPVDSAAPAALVGPAANQAAAPVDPAAGPAAPAEPAAALTDPLNSAEPAEPADDALDERCARLGDEFGLTEREREVFVLLAHGRNGRYIMDNLVISRNTAKTHIKHIYSKLGVHSHQELIDLASGAEQR